MVCANCLSEVEQAIDPVFTTLHPLEHMNPYQTYVFHHCWFGEFILTAFSHVTGALTGEKKLTKSVVPEVRKASDAEKTGSSSKTGESSGRAVNPNMLLMKSKRFTPYDKKCKVCKSLLVQPGIYCQGCAYKSGICSMCGVKILDTKMYKQSST